MKKFAFTSALLFLAMIPMASAITWDLTDQDCDAFDGGWSNNDVGNGTVTLVTEDGRSAWKFYTPGPSGDYAYVNNTSLSWNSNCTIEVVFKIESDVSDTFFDMSVYARDSDRHHLDLRMNYDSDWPYPYGGIRSYSGAAYITIRSFVDISTSSWHTARVVVKDDYVTAWVDGYLIYSNYGPSDTALTGFTPDTLGIVIHGGNEGAKTFYIDDVKMSSEVEAPSVAAPLKINGENIVSRIYQPTSRSGFVSQSPLRYLKGNCTYQSTIIHQIPLVATADTNASSVRVYDGSDTKALMKLPTF